MYRQRWVQLLNKDRSSTRCMVRFLRSGYGSRNTIVRSKCTHVCLDIKYSLHLFTGFRNKQESFLVSALPKLQFHFPCKLLSACVLYFLRCSRCARLFPEHWRNQRCAWACVCLPYVCEKAKKKPMCLNRCRWYNISPSTSPFIFRWRWQSRELQYITSSRNTTLSFIRRCFFRCFFTLSFIRRCLYTVVH